MESPKSYPSKSKRLRFVITPCQPLVSVFAYNSGPLKKHESTMKLKRMCTDAGERREWRMCLIQAFFTFTENLQMKIVFESRYLHDEGNHR